MYIIYVYPLCNPFVTHRYQTIAILIGIQALKQKEVSIIYLSELSVKWVGVGRP